jgi:alpha-tubulin suppressor-like RCC1 family protein
MSITKNVFRLNETYDLINSGQWVQYDIKSDPGTLWTFGYNNTGQLGDNTIISKSSPVQVPGTQWTQVAAGNAHTLARKSDGTLWAWGVNSFGILGVSDSNTVLRRSSPVQIPGTQWKSISTNLGTTAVATKTDGTLWAWGRNDRGPVGNSTTIDQSSPIQIPGNVWNFASSGGGASYNGHTLATKTDGTLWTWGNNQQGQLGHGNATHRSSPVQVPGTQWSEVFAGDFFSVARKTDGTLWSWGFNNNGQLGQNNVTSRSSPVQIPGENWVFASAGSSRAVALKTDGTLWTWGTDSFGRLGIGSTGPKSSPVQIPGNQWKSTAIGDNSLAQKNDGTLWVWGPNSSGAAGSPAGAGVFVSSPIQIPGTQWSDVTTGSGYQTSFARKAV